MGPPPSKFNKRGGWNKNVLSGKFPKFLYLNQVYLGGGYYGVKSAFRGYFDKELSEWAMYNNSGIDVGMDNIDNDLDGLIDSEDSDEYGSSREAALRIASNKISDRIIDEWTSTWYIRDRKCI